MALFPHEPEPETTPAAEPAVDPGEAGEGDEAAAATASEVEDFLENATAEDLESIRANPALAKVHGSMLRDYKTKTTSLAEQRKALEAKEAEINARAEAAAQAQKLMDALNDNPEAVIRGLAERRGLTIAEATAAVKAADDKELVELFGDDAGKIQPIFDSVVDKRVEQRLAPVAARLQQIEEAQKKREISADIQEFQNELAERGEEVTPEIETKMREIAAKIDPGPETSVRDYIELLYTIATSGKTRKEVAREVATRMTRAVRGREPAELPTTGATGGGPEITDKMSLREALRAAAPSVRREMGRR